MPLAGVEMTALMDGSPVRRRVAGGKRLRAPLIDDVPRHIQVREVGPVCVPYGRD